MSGIDLVELLRTGNIVRQKEVSFHEYIIVAAELFRENDFRMGQTYFNVLLEMRPDIANHIRGTDKDAFYDNDKLPTMLAEVYKRWK